MAITKEQLKKVRVAMQAALDELSKKDPSFKYKVGNCSFGDTAATFKVEASLNNGTIAGKEADAFRQLATYYGLKAEDLGADVSIVGKSFTIVGLKDRCAMPILVEDGDGKRMRFKPEPVLRGLGREVPEWLLSKNFN